MGQAYFITGTGTDIGKTVVTSFLYKVLIKIGVKTTILNPFKLDIEKIFKDIQTFIGLKQH